jgi:hypothetical protein
LLAGAVSGHEYVVYCCQNTLNQLVSIFKLYEYSLKTKFKSSGLSRLQATPNTIVYAESFRQGSFKLQSRHVGCPALISDCSPSSCGQRNRLTQSTTPSSLVLVLALVFELHMQAGRQQWRFVSVSVAFLSYFPLSLSLLFIIIW